MPRIPSSGKEPRAASGIHTWEEPEGMAAEPRVATARAAAREPAAEEAVAMGPPGPSAAARRMQVAACRAATARAARPDRVASSAASSTEAASGKPVREAPGGPDLRDA